MAKANTVLICSVPNVGKSTLINTLSNKRQAKTGTGGHHQAGAAHHTGR